ncbi:MAG TPA: glycoside hydrolase family 97 N-terminal domain-containing protein, partial [Bryobacteraceae bacterium]|nr:glycoside hydrolase family 97 N-terminal domain-containing protein [Bryobacteraceae bacterium]
MCSYSRLILTTAIMLAAWPAAAQTGSVEVKSPDGSLAISVATLAGVTPAAGGGQLAYQVTLRGKAVMDWSRLGLEIQGGPTLGAQVKILSAERSSHDEKWPALHGKANSIRDHYNAATIRTAESGRSGRLLNLEVRAYDDGVAFRYLVPEQPSIREMRLSAEATQFRASKDATTYPLILRDYRSSYEDDYH